MLRREDSEIMDSKGIAFRGLSHGRMTYAGYQDTSALLRLFLLIHGLSPYRQRPFLEELSVEAA